MPPLSWLDYTKNPSLRSFRKSKPSHLMNQIEPKPWNWHSTKNSNHSNGPKIVPKSDQNPNHGPLTCHIQLVGSQDQNEKTKSWSPLTCRTQLVRSQDQNQNPKPNPLTCHIQLVRSQGQKTKNLLDRLMRHTKPLGSQGQKGKSKTQKPNPNVIFKILPWDGTWYLSLP